MILAAGLTATLMAAVSIVARSGYTAWRVHEEDDAVVQAAHATLRHVVRRLRQAASVKTISAPGDPEGRLELRMGPGPTIEWELLPGTDEVEFRGLAGSGLLARGVDELYFVGYEADGTPTTVSPKIRIVECRAVVTPPHGGGPQTIFSRGWIRSW